MFPDKNFERIRRSAKCKFNLVFERNRMTEYVDSVSKMCIALV